MRYLYSQTDKSNLEWFEKDTSKTTLMRFEIGDGEIRGLSDLKLQFRYPVTAISGKNGTGKSTVLACVACGYHNSRSGFKALNRRIPYYRFSDFFIQSAEEEPIAFVSLGYQFLHDNWRKTREMRSGVGLGWQMRRKFFGRWNNYASRVPRNVVFCGIERVVPHAEKSVSKSYRRAFQKAKEAGYEVDVAATVGRILGRPYDEFYYKQHSKYRLPLVRVSKRSYSGFNMGAGENTLFEIFSTIYACEGSLLLVIDEIELGLHEEAQIRFIEELKEICLKRHHQVVCTTHSPRILAALPPEGRIHLERMGNTIRVIPKISPEYAAGLLSGIKQSELKVYCEDDFAHEVITLALPNELRSRVTVIPIGSAAAVVRVLAARFKEKSERASCGIIDGDQVQRKAEHVNVFISALENIKDRDASRDWIENRLTFLPSEARPETWVIKTVASDVSDNLADDFGVSKEELKSHIEAASGAKDHTEIHVLGTKLNLPASIIRTRLIRAALQKSPDDVSRIVEFVKRFLS
jgi:predicted ATPase